MILSVAAFAEECLGQLLLTYLIGGKHAEDLVEGFNAPLGTLSARIKGAYAVGLLSDQQFEDLERIRKIRNEFAHNWAGCTFGSPKVASLIGQLNPSRIDSNGNSKPRDILYSTATCILVELECLRGQLTKRSRRAISVAMHLSLKPSK
nr:MltR family transcriptional regulator [Bradyrhizobium sp. 197]